MTTGRKHPIGAAEALIDLLAGYAGTADVEAHGLHALMVRVQHYHPGGDPQRR